MEGLKIINVNFDTAPFVKELESKPQKIRSKLQSDASKITELILDSSEPYVPVDTGDLRASGYVHSDYHWRGDDGFLYLQMEYSAFDKGFDYAYVQHEGNDRISPKKYLYKGMSDASPFVEKIIEVDVRSALRSD